MKKNTPAAIVLMLSLISIVAFSVSCKKEKEPDDELIGYEVGQFESITSDVDNMVGQVCQGNGDVNQKIASSGNQFGFSGCALVTHDSANHHITIDFGSGCTGLDGRVRAGKIQVDYSGNYFVQGSSHIVTLDSFYVDSKRLQGSRIITNRGLNSSSLMYWTVEASNMKLTSTDGYWRSWSSNRHRELLSGGGDNQWANDVYRINGSADGTNSNGFDFTIMINDLVRDNSCHWITSGSIAITPSNRITRTIDFGNGSCDDQATVTVGNKTTSISLR